MPSHTLFIYNLNNVRKMWLQDTVLYDVNKVKWAFSWHSGIYYLSLWFILFLSYILD